MAWINWSRTWRTTRTKTTTIRKPQRCSSKTMRWNRMHVLSRADQRLKQNHKDVFLPAHPQKLYLSWKEFGLVFEPQDYPSTDHSVSKKLINLLRHGCLLREDDGAIEFWRIQDYLKDHFVFCHRWSDEKLKSSMAGGGHKKYFSCVLILQEQFLYFRVLQGHSGRSLIDPTLQTMSLVRATSSNALVMSHGQPIHIPSSIRDWYLEVNFWATDRLYSFCLWIPCTKTIRILDTIDLNAPRHAQYMHKAQKKHLNTVYWSTSILLWRKDWRSIRRDRNAIILYNTLPAYCIPKPIKTETGEIIYQKVFESPRPPPKISLRNDWMKEVGPEVAGQAEGSQPTQPNPNPIFRAGRPVGTEQTSRSSAQEIDTRFSLDCENTNLFERLERETKTQTKTQMQIESERYDPLVDTGLPARGDVHRLQGVWIATCCCETIRKFSCSWTREEDPESPSSTRSSSRSTTKRCLQPI